LIVLATGLAGALLAAEILSLEYFVWADDSMVLGGGLGLGLAYGFLPES